MSNFPKAKARELNRHQKRALRRIIRFYVEREAYTGVTSVRWELCRIHANKKGRNTYSLRLRTRRSDCNKYSMRAIACESTAHILIGPMGAIDVASAYSGLGNSKKHRAHVKRMLK